MVYAPRPQGETIPKIVERVFVFAQWENEDRRRSSLDGAKFAMNRIEMVVFMGIGDRFDP